MRSLAARALQRAAALTAAPLRVPPLPPPARTATALPAPPLRRPRALATHAPAVAACWSVRAHPSLFIHPLREPPAQPSHLRLMTTHRASRCPRRYPPQCGASRSGGDLYFCGACHVILPPDEAHDHFALLASPRAFDLPHPALEAAYKNAAKALHPDKFSARPEARAGRGKRDACGRPAPCVCKCVCSDAACVCQAERTHSAAQAARLNAAYAVLRAPLSRARYLVRSLLLTTLSAALVR
jgi:hypothetical protein